MEMRCFSDVNAHLGASKVQYANELKAFAPNPLAQDCDYVCVQEY